ncbi:Fe-S cluster assembly protein SufD [Candidatus Blochmannia ocreatus (nom. nud.)]|uniref:Fe-S cluster assembly protein SufD n=1 Tax=Candidatus Blochmannia ocreatus (nom. nud.) TaxID=251538 RepID=A0ABY4SV38_9ENTR|nr:Fe-S cluster assembly protein SufD [Candidatus Blochmannia ocreatus]URJ24870.1 Fe-S cluster assembly protein SufD [Candidatus Blochmannia ocreatus]
MVGCPNNEDRVLNEWFKLFKQKNHTYSDIAHKYWNYIKTSKLNTLNNKNWKTNIFNELLTYNLEFSKNEKIDIAQYKKLSLPIDAYKLVFINGKFSYELSNKNIKPWIIKINHNPNRYEVHTAIKPNTFLYLTQCLSDATIHINLPPNNATTKPLYLIYITEGSNIKNQLITSHYNHYIEIDNNSKTHIIEHFVNTNSNSHFSGSYISMVVKNNATLNHIKLIFENRASYHISHNDINIGKNSQVKSNTFVILGPKLTYNNTYVKLNYPHTSVSLNNLFFLSKKDIGTINSYIEHNNQGYSLSRQLHKIIACEKSTGIFNGLIKVQPNSTQTDGKMTNNNLLLNNNATINSTPKLEIYSDNVKCSHGATIGQINNDHLFYLRTRGISQKNALKMLIYAFSVEVIELIKDDMLKSIIISKINTALKECTYDYYNISH